VCQVTGMKHRVESLKAILSLFTFVCSFSKRALTMFFPALFSQKTTTSTVRMRPSRLLFAKYRQDDSSDNTPSKKVRRRASLIVNDVARVSILPIIIVSEFVLRAVIEHTHHAGPEGKRVSRSKKRRRHLWVVRISDSTESSDEGTRHKDDLEFFDCVSELDSNEVFYDCFACIEECGYILDEGSLRTLRETCHDSTTIAIYKDGACVYPDESSAFVPRGCSVAHVPQNYLDFCHGHPEKARIKWNATQEWRKREEVWNIHQRPHPHFQKINEAYPHVIHGHSKTGEVVIYEHPGHMNLKKLFREECHVSDMLVHLTYFLEYIDNCVATSDEIQTLWGKQSFGTMVVMDVKGAHISCLTPDVLHYLSQSGALQSAHYPHVLQRVFVVNCPTWAIAVWSMVKTVVPESVHVEILSEHNTVEALRQYIDDEEIPREYGGSSFFALGEHPYELGLKELVQTTRIP